MAIRLKWGDGTPESLQQLVDMYFCDCRDRNRIPTTEGICLALGISRETWYYYQSGRYRRHTPSYLKNAHRMPKSEQINNPPSDEDMASVDSMEWPDAKLAITGDGGDEDDWSTDQRLRYAAGDILKRAGMMMAEWLMQESYQIQRGGKNPIFSMFALKATHGYKEEAPYLAPPAVEETSTDALRIEIQGVSILKIADDNCVKPADSAGSSGK